MCLPASATEAGWRQRFCGAVHEGAAPSTARGDAIFTQDKLESRVADKFARVLTRARLIRTIYGATGASNDTSEAVRMALSLCIQHDFAPISFSLAKLILKSSCAVGT